MSFNPRDPYAFDYLLGRDLGAIKGNHTLNHQLPQGREFENKDYSGSFSYNAEELLDPSSELSQRYPQVSQVLRDRLGLAFANRNNEEFSRCNCQDDSGHRCDSEVFQKHASSSYDDFIRLSSEGKTTAKAVCLCPDLLKRVQIYGFIGAGSKIILSPCSNILCMDTLLTDYSIWCHIYCSRERRCWYFPGRPWTIRNQISSPHNTVDG